MTKPIAGSLMIALAAAIVGACTRDGGTAGIDGTGVRAPVAAVAYGRVTEFGSVWVDGVRYDTTNAVFMIDGEPGTQADLGIGDIVFLTGRSIPGGSTGTAEEIALDHVVVGPIKSIDGTTGAIVALGQSINVTVETAFADSIARGLADLRVGAQIEVSGFRKNAGEIEATRIAKRSSASAELRTTGKVASVDTAAKRLNVAALVVDYAAATVLPVGHVFTIGDVVEVRGSTLAANGSLVATSVKLKAGAVGAVGASAHIEGFVTAIDASDPLSFAVAGVPVKATRMTLIEGTLSLNLKVAIEGFFDAEGVVIARIITTGLAQLSGRHTLQGQVFDAYEGLIPSIPINLWVQTPKVGYSYWWGSGAPLGTDASGRFVAYIPDSEVTLMAFKQGNVPAASWLYVQPCAVTVGLEHDLELNLEVVSAQTLNSLAPPRPQSATGPTLTGRIFETTAAGREPVAGAKLWVENANEIAQARTLSDLSGGYFLCNLPTDAYLYVTKDGFQSLPVGPINGTQTSVQDFELRRN